MSKSRQLRALQTRVVVFAEGRETVHQGFVDAPARKVNEASYLGTNPGPGFEASRGFRCLSPERSNAPVVETDKQGGSLGKRRVETAGGAARAGRSKHAAQLLPASSSSRASSVVKTGRPRGTGTGSRGRTRLPRELASRDAAARLRVSAAKLASAHFRESVPRRCLTRAQSALDLDAPRDDAHGRAGHVSNSGQVVHSDPASAARSEGQGP